MWCISSTASLQTTVPLFSIFREAWRYLALSVIPLKDQKSAFSKNMNLTWKFAFNSSYNSWPKNDRHFISKLQALKIFPSVTFCSSGNGHWLINGNETSVFHSLQGIHYNAATSSSVRNGYLRKGRFRPPPPRSHFIGVVRNIYTLFFSVCFSVYYYCL